MQVEFPTEEQLVEDPGIDEVEDISWTYEPPAPPAPPEEEEVVEEVIIEPYEINYPPEITREECSGLTMAVSTSYSYSCVIEFADSNLGDTLTYTFSPILNWVTFNNGVITFSPNDNNLSRIHTFFVKATDNNSVEDPSGEQYVFQIFSIIVLGINTPPEFTSEDVTDQTITVGDELVVSMPTWKDAETPNDLLIEFSSGSGSLPYFVTTSTNGQVRLAPKSNKSDPGTYMITMSVTDTAQF